MQQNEQKQAQVPHVIEAIGLMTAAVAKEGIGKTKENKDQKYKFRGIDDVRNVLAPLMDECKLVIIPKMKARSEKERTTKSGGFALQVVVEIDFHFISRVDGSEIVVPMSNEAVDYSDKATNKAISQAYKTVCINTFNIPTEGEEDTDDDKKKDLRGSKRTTHASREACDKFVEDYLRAVAGAETRHALRDVGTVHATTLTSMQASEDEHERLMAAMCRDKHAEALEELKKQDAQVAKPATVDGMLAKSKSASGLPADEPQN
jgi:hypothetical protein